MKGKNHLWMNTLTGLACGSSLSWVVTKMPTEGRIVPYFYTTGLMVRRFVMDSKGLNPWVYLGVSIGLYYLGSILPDADNPNSMVGRRFHVPIGHRTWLHAIWIPILCWVGGSLWFKPLFWLGVGYFFHLVWDSPSAMGNCFFYPISGYIEYSSGAKVKRSHKLKLYRYGDPSEMYFVFIFSIILLAFIGWLWYNKVSPLDFVFTSTK